MSLISLIEFLIDPTEYRKGVAREQKRREQERYQRREQEILSCRQVQQELCTASGEPLSLQRIREACGYVRPKTSGCALLRVLKR